MPFTLPLKSQGPLGKRGGEKVRAGWWSEGLKNSILTVAMPTGIGPTAVKSSS